MKGWICLHRGIVDHWIYQEPEALKLWITMLIEANHENKKHMFNGAMIEINRGQLVCGRISLAGRTGISENKIRRYLELLETDGMIHQQKSNKCSIISITNYTEYQDIHQQSTSKPPAEDEKNHQQTTSTSGPQDYENQEENLQAQENGNQKPPANHQQELLKTTTPKQITNNNNSTGGTKVPPCPHQEVINLYHEILPMGTQVREWTESRSKTLQARWREKPDRQTIDFWQRFFEYVSESKFLTGRVEAKHDRDPFVVNLEWLIRPKNFVRVLEGYYHRERA